MMHRSYLIFLSISHKALLETGSNPDEGSSKKIVVAFPIKAIAKLNFLLFPPLNS